MGKIIKFPDQSDKVESVKKESLLSGYQNYIIIGLCVVFVFAVVLNISFQNQNSQSRKLANYESQISGAKLDDYILKSLNSSDQKTEIVFSTKANQEDRFIFETLLGNYDVIKVKGKITQAYLKAGYKALSAFELPNILSQYRRTLGVNSLEFQLKEKADQKSNVFNYTLISKGDEIGDLKVTLSDDKKIISIDTKFK